MAYPVQLAGARSYSALQAALIQAANNAVDLDTRIRAVQHAYAGVTATDFEQNGAPPGSGATYVTLMSNFATFLASPAWTALMGTAFVDSFRDIGR